MKNLLNIRWGRSAILCSGVVLLAACAQPSQWQHPTIPQNKWAADVSDCRHRASLLVERDIEREGPFQERNQITVQRQFSLFDAKKRSGSLTASCLRDKGYVSVKMKS